tara:strand:- start:285 stop:890 length:606 start_codon:yes stop_codon:yes gene_type:complete
MSEWIKFTFTSNTLDIDGAPQGFSKGVIKKYFDGEAVIPAEGGESWTGIGDLDNRQTREIWHEITDDICNSSDDHTICFTLSPAVDDETGEPVSEVPSVDLIEISISGDVHTLGGDQSNNEDRTDSLHGAGTVMNEMSPEIQAMIDDGQWVSHGFVTEDIGFGEKQYTICDFVSPGVTGSGAWKFSFSCPFLDWFEDTLVE